MNRTKKKIAALQDYLSRDAAGLKLLDAIKREVVDQQKENRLTDGKLLEMQKTIEELKAQRTQLIRSDYESRCALDAAEKKVVLLKRKLASLESPVDEKPIPRASKSVDAKQLVRQLVKELPNGVQMRTPRFDDPVYFELREIVNGFSGVEMMKLGRLVASCSLCLSSGVHVGNTEWNIDTVPMEVKSQFTRWFKRNIEGSEKQTPASSNS